MKINFFLLLLILTISFDSLNNRSFAKKTGVNQVMTDSDHYYFNVGRMMAHCRAHAYGAALNPIFNKVTKKELKGIISILKDQGITSNQLRDIRVMLRKNFPDCPI